MALDFSALLRAVRKKQPWDEELPMPSRPPSMVPDDASYEEKLQADPFGFNTPTPLGEPPAPSVSMAQPPIPNAPSAWNANARAAAAENTGIFAGLNPLLFGDKLLSPGESEAGPSPRASIPGMSMPNFAGAAGGQVTGGETDPYDQYMVEHQRLHGTQEHKGFKNRFMHILQGAGLGALGAMQGGGQDPNPLARILAGAATGGVLSGVRPQSADVLYNKYLVEPEAEHVYQKAVIQQRVRDEQLKRGAEVGKIYAETQAAEHEDTRKDTELVYRGQELQLKIAKAIADGDLNTAEVLLKTAQRHRLENQPYPIGPHGAQDPNTGEIIEGTGGDTNPYKWESDAELGARANRDESTVKEIAESSTKGDPNGWTRYVSMADGMTAAEVTATLQQAAAGEFVEPPKLLRATQIQREAAARQQQANEAYTQDVRRKWLQNPANRQRVSKKGSSYVEGGGGTGINRVSNIGDY